LLPFLFGIAPPPFKILIDFTLVMEIKYNRGVHLLQCQGRIPNRNFLGTHSIQIVINDRFNADSCPLEMTCCCPFHRVAIPYILVGLTTQAGDRGRRQGDPAPRLVLAQRALWSGDSGATPAGYSPISRSSHQFFLSRSAGKDLITKSMLNQHEKA